MTLIKILKTKLLNNTFLSIISTWIARRSDIVLCRLILRLQWIRVSFLAQMWQKWKCTKAQNKSLFLWKKWTFWIFATEKVSCLKKKTDGLFIISGFDHKKWRLTSIGETKIFGFVRFLRLIWALEFPKKTKVLKKCKDRFSFFFPA